MRIGIVTFWWSEDNYGQILQLFALQTYLKKGGHHPFLIRYAPWKDRRLVVLFSTIGHTLFHPAKIWRFIVNGLTDYRIRNNNRKHDRKFTSFLKQEICFTERIYSAADLCKYPPVADVYITGSDQVWGGRLPHPIYFLQFGDPKVKRISFSASFGDSLIFFHPFYYKKLKPCLDKFDFITVRDAKALEICRNAGIQGASLIPDPTLMIDLSHYDRLCSDQVVPSGPYCLVYMLEKENLATLKIEAISAFINAKGLKMIYVASQGRFDKFPKSYPTIPEFLSYIKNAEFVITNSFHGAVFSILYTKKFAIVPQRKGNRTRIDTLLSRYGLERHLAEIPSHLERAYNQTMNRINIRSVTLNNRMETEALFSEKLSSLS